MIHYTCRTALLTLTDEAVKCEAVTHREVEMKSLLLNTLCVLHMVLDGVEVEQIRTRANEARINERLTVLEQDFLNRKLPRTL